MEQTQIWFHTYKGHFQEWLIEISHRSYVYGNNKKIQLRKRTNLLKKIALIIEWRGKTGIKVKFVLNLSTKNVDLVLIVYFQNDYLIATYHAHKLPHWNIKSNLITKIHQFS